MRQWPRLLRICAVAAGLATWLATGLIWAGAASAKDGAIEVDVELVLAVDISYSMDPEEQRLQREGYAQALTSPQFQEALRSGAYGKIALVYLQWAAAHDHDVLLPWTVIDGPASARAFAERLMEAPYRRAQRTSISGALETSLKLFDGNGFNGMRRVIDVSGDGTNNSGRPVQEARDAAIRAGVTINGLPLLLRPSSWGFNDVANLDEYYEDCVIGGVGAFSIPIRDRAQFVNATRTKLVQEIAYKPTMKPGSQDGLVQFAQQQQREPRVNCMVGESLWRNRWGN